MLRNFEEQRVISLSVGQKKIGSELYQSYALYEHFFEERDNHSNFVEYIFVPRIWNGKDFNYTYRQRQLASRVLSSKREHRIVPIIFLGYE